jgi:N-acyl-D-aspartate/D-glutamate deacylase
MEAWLLHGGTVFDGSRAPGRRADVLVRDGRVAAIEAPGVLAPTDARRVDCTGCWVSPGFIDLHTHYDAEVEVLPSLSESLRHGVTTVLLGSCGLSLVMGDPTDLADMFCRVEGIPRDIVLPLLQQRKTWDGAADYLAHLEDLPLGPNVTCMLGHSTLRAKVMGLGRSLDASVQPSEAELAAMGRLLEEALDAGFLGLSINTLPWDKMDGEAYRSRPTPSVFASWREYRHLTSILRRREALFQGVPDVSRKWNAVHFFWESLGLWRKPLRTMILTLFDARATRGQHRLIGAAARLVNALGGPIRLQSLPHPFDIWSDGLEVPVLEEVAAGTEALHHVDPEARAALLRDPAFRERFKQQWRAWFGRAYHRDLDEARVMDCPDASVVGRSFASIARDRGVEPEDAFLDLNAEHGDALRWMSVVGNDRPPEVEWIAGHPSVLIGFSDAGAHLRNMAFYNFGLRLLKRVRDAEAAGRPFLDPAAALHRLTGEIADYLGIDAGHLEPGRRADVVVIDPEALDDRLEALHEAPMEGFGDMRRMVRRNDDAVRAVLVGGRLAWSGGEPAPALGRERLGAVLR